MSAKSGTYNAQVESIALVTAPEFNGFALHSRGTC